MKKLSFWLFCALTFISSMNIITTYAEHISFKSAEHTLSGYYIKPDSKAQTKGVVLFVHGDGTLPYDAHGYYEPIWDQLLDAGYAVFSWDKLGVGGSSGDWLNQSMQDRQNEVLAAIDFVKNKYGYQSGYIGLMGFSQAGWVAPAVAKNNKDVGFLIGVGFAINWLDQSWYLTKMRLTQEQATQKEIDQAYKKHQKEAMFWTKSPTYQQYLKQFATDTDSMSKARFEFVKKNVLSDAQKDYQDLRQPTLILLGEKDLNVDVKNTWSVLNKVSNGHNNLAIRIIPNATHSLLKHSEFGTQNPGLYFLLKLIWYGDDAYSPAFFNELRGWIKSLPNH